MSFNMKSFRKTCADRLGSNNKSSFEEETHLSNLSKNEHLNNDDNAQVVITTSYRSSVATNNKKSHVRSLSGPSSPFTPRICNPSRNPKKSNRHFDVSKDMSASRRSSSSDVSRDERQSSSSAYTSNHSSKSRFTEESSDSSYSRRSHSKSASDSGASSNESVTILSTVTISRLGGHSKTLSSKSKICQSKYPHYKNVSKKVRKARSTSRYKKHEKSYDKPKHISHEKQKRSRERRRRKRSISSVSSDSASHSTYYKSRRPYNHEQSGKVLSNYYRSSPESLNQTVASHDMSISNDRYRKLSSRSVYYRSRSRSVSSDGRLKNCQGVNDSRDKISFRELSKSKLTNDLRGRRNDVSNSSKGKFQERYYGAGIEDDTNHELNKYSSGKFQGRYFETGNEGHENESNKNPRGNFEDSFHETGIESDRKNGDWYCDECGNLNFCFRIYCNRCDVAKQEKIRKKDACFIPEEGKKNSYKGMDFRLKVSQDLGRVVRNSQDKKKLHWGKSVKKYEYIKNYVGGKYRCDICDVTVGNQHQIQIHMDGNSHKKKCGEVDSFYCELCMVGVTCQATLDSHRKGKNHLKRVKQEEDRNKLQPDEQRDITGKNGKPTAKEKQELDMLKVEIRTLQRTVKSLENLNQHCESYHSSAEYQELLKYKTRCKDKHVRSKIQLKKSFKELKNESIADGDVKNQERKEGIANFKGKIEKRRNSDTDNDYSPPILTGGLKNSYKSRTSNPKMVPNTLSTC